MKRFFALLLGVWLVFSFTGCDMGDDNGNDKPPETDTTGGITWDPEPNGTLTVSNNTNRDMVLFQGQTPSASTILGGVRALSTRAFDISGAVEDFNVGGYMIIRGIAFDEYQANIANLSRARIEYSAMATYGQGRRFRTEISPNFTGDYVYRVTNLGRIGMELRKDSPDGEKVGFLPALATNVNLYAESTTGFAIFPVFVFYSRSTGQVTTLKPTSQFETVGISPRPATDSSIQAYTLPTSEDPWASIMAQLSSPVAYITVTNNVPNQSGRVTIGGGRFLTAQNGYDSIGIGETLTYELQSTADGAQQNLVLTFYNQALQIPVLLEGAMPTIRNGYDYTINVTGTGQNVAGYTVTITESANPRDLSNDIASL